MKLLGIVLLLCTGVALAQLMQRKEAGLDTINVGAKKGPMVYSDPKDNGKTAIGEATASMDSREYSNDSTVGTLIGVGAEFVGDMVKGMLSPNSPETDAVELERTRK